MNELFYYFDHLILFVSFLKVIITESSNCNEGSSLLHFVCEQTHEIVNLSSFVPYLFKCKYNKLGLKPTMMTYVPSINNNL